MISFLAKHPAGQLALIPVAIIFGAWSWLVHNLLSRNPARPEMQRAWWGWRSDAMSPHWARLAHPKSPEYGSWFHSLKNVLTEWVRLDAERAGKALSFVIVAAWLSGITIGVTVACDNSNATLWASVVYWDDDGL